MLVEIVNKFLWIGSTGSTNRDVFLSSRGMDGSYFEIVIAVVVESGLGKMFPHRVFFSFKKSMPKD
jgi:hypothetical protein